VLDKTSFNLSTSSLLRVISMAFINSFFISCIEMLSSPLNALLSDANSSPLLDFNISRCSKCDFVEPAIHVAIKADHKISFLKESKPFEDRLSGKEIDNSIYFTLYQLWKIADSLNQARPFHFPITYDRTKVAVKIYTVLSNSGLVDIKKIDSDTYVTTTKKGDDVSERFLQDLNSD
jgi:hypothetical protein